MSQPPRRMFALLYSGARTTPSAGCESPVRHFQAGAAPHDGMGACAAAAGGPLPDLPSTGPAGRPERAARRRFGRSACPSRRRPTVMRQPAARGVATSTRIDAASPLATCHARSSCARATAMLPFFGKRYRISKNNFGPIYRQARPNTRPETPAAATPRQSPPPAAGRDPERLDAKLAGR